MLLVTAATDSELADLRSQFNGNAGVDFLVTGVGLVDTAHSLTAYIERHKDKISAVINMGVGGAFPGGSTKTLDLCLASSEVIGDMAICFADTLSPLGSAELVLHQFFPCQGSLLDGFQKWCVETRQHVQLGAFVSVNCVSATRKRGEMLATTYKAICENMEGGAVARVCQSYELQWLELRCMSNMVEDRDTSTWRLHEAAQKCSATIAAFLTDYLN